MTRTFDRVVRFDDRSRAYSVRRRLAAGMPRSVSWACLAHLDQGTEGACVGFGLAHEIAADPFASRVTATFARERIYWAAQRRDEYPGGDYPGARPRMAGTSLLAGLKAIRELGACDAYDWAFGIDDLILGLQSGPAVLGLSWYEGMMTPDRRGYVEPSGRVVGGHCILCRGVDLGAGCLIMRNSWGEGWGDHGDCRVTLSEMGFLLSQRGEAAFLVRRHFIDIDHLPNNDLPAPPRASWWARLWAWIKGTP